MRLDKLIKGARVDLGLSQIELASRAGVGMATIQNIEADKGNPSFDTLKSILKVLGIDIRFSKKKLRKNWNEWASHGCPILHNKEAVSEPSKSRLIEILQNINSVGLSRRESRAVSAWLSAIQDHYPSLWLNVPAATRAWAQNQPAEAKLRRIALNHLGSFL